MMYGYGRVSTELQCVDRQITNIILAFPYFNNHRQNIYAESITGRTLSRPKWNMLMKQIRYGDTIVFDDVSRMARNAEEGFALYKELFFKGIKLIFLKNSDINTEEYQKALNGVVQINFKVDDKSIDSFIIEATEMMNKLALNHIEQKIYQAFVQAENEVNILSQRISEGIRDAKAKGARIGTPKGTKLTTKKSKAAKEIILKHAKAFGGTLTDKETWTLARICKTSYYKYKQELQEEMRNKTIL